jgi:hypothetical protein
MKGLGIKVAAVLVLGSLALCACGDDDVGDAGDSGPDAGTSGRSGTGGRGMIPRSDAQVTGGDPVPDCDRFDPQSCAAGQQCRVVVRRPPGADGFMIYGGCVEGVEGRALGQPCDQFGGAFHPYEAPGLEDEVYVDPCAPGLFCAPDPKVRNLSTCQTACELESNVACSSPSQYCVTTGQGTQLEEVCIDSDGCDPNDPGSCAAGESCFLHINDTGDALQTVCLPLSTMPVADGEPCTAYNSCNPGSSCWGPTRVPPSRWQDTDLICRRTCSTALPPGGGDGDDAGGASDEDGGTALRGECLGGTSCVDFSGSGLSGASATIGQCE